MIVYCDGGCRGNGQEENIGANGFLIVKNKEVVHYYTEVHKNTTNNQQELLAAINAITYINQQPKEQTTIYSDSQYLIKGITIWSKTWYKNKWKKGKNSKHDVKNKELWQTLYNLNNPSITWEWVKGHSNNIYNNQIDKLLNEDMDLG